MLNEPSDELSRRSPRRRAHARCESRPLTRCAGAWQPPTPTPHPSRRGGGCRTRRRAAREACSPRAKLPPPRAAARLPAKILEELRRRRSRAPARAARCWRRRAIPASGKHAACSFIRRTTFSTGRRSARAVCRALAPLSATSARPASRRERDAARAAVEAGGDVGRRPDVVHHSFGVREGFRQEGGARAQAVGPRAPGDAVVARVVAANGASGDAAAAQGPTFPRRRRHVQRAAAGDPRLGHALEAHGGELAAGFYARRTTHFVCGDISSRLSRQRRCKEARRGVSPRIPVAALIADCVESASRRLQTPPVHVRGEVPHPVSVTPTAPTWCMSLASRRQVRGTEAGTTSSAAPSHSRATRSAHGRHQPLVEGQVRRAASSPSPGSEHRRLDDQNEVERDPKLRPPAASAAKDSGAQAVRLSAPTMTASVARAAGARK